MNKLPQIPSIEFDANGIPSASAFGDTYFSKSGGIDECRAVFINGCGLPHAWRGKENYVIAETGFGTGLNFLTTWKLWDEESKSGNAPKILHFISFELYPFTKTQAVEALQHYPELEKYSKILLEKWPRRAFGVQRIWICENIALTIVIGDIENTLPQLSFTANAWFLDGFTPSRNEKMWSDVVFANIARLCKPDARIATYSVSGLVKNGLSNAGFIVQKQKGFATKRERLEAYLPNDEFIAPNQANPKTAIIIGGGIAGHAAAFALSKRGIKAIIIDNDKDGLIKASNNPAGLIMPRLDKVESNEARLYRAAFLFAAALYESLSNGYFPCPIIEHPKSDRDLTKFTALENDPPFDSDLLRFGAGTLTHYSGGIVRPKELLSALLLDGEIINTDARKLVRNEAGNWCAHDIAGALIAEGEVCIIASGAKITDFCDFAPRAIYGGAGTICHAKDINQSDFTNFGGKSYCLGLLDAVVFGASFKRCELSQTPYPSQEEIDNNIKNLFELAPKIASQIDKEKLIARASMRVVTKDLLPIIGPLEHEGPNLYAIGALGSRGFSLAPIAGEIVASLVCNEPIPLEDKLLNIIAPNRLLQK